MYSDGDEPEQVNVKIWYNSDELSESDAGEEWNARQGASPFYYDQTHFQSPEHTPPRPASEHSPCNPRRHPDRATPAMP
jgi:hypothetical protein